MKRTVHGRFGPQKKGSYKVVCRLQRKGGSFARVAWLAICAKEKSFF
ncbi:MAG: hypothetical protein ABFS09_03330 [Thermodesulfobacteriota bacterium]